MIKELLGFAVGAVFVGALGFSVHYITVLSFVLELLEVERRESAWRPGGWVDSLTFYECSPLSWSILRRLERQGVVERVETPGPPVRGGRPKYFFRLKPEQRPS